MFRLPLSQSPLSSIMIFHWVANNNSITCGTSGTGNCLPLRRAWVNPRQFVEFVLLNIYFLCSVLWSLLFVCLNSFSHCIVCLSLTYGFWLPYWCNKDTFLMLCFEFYYQFIALYPMEVLVIFQVSLITGSKTLLPSQNKRWIWV